jgi:branched-chain amino acid transport system ATP-binding protein
MSDILEVVDLQKSFGGVTATKNVSLTVRAGEVHAIIGPNGAGKTTLISQLSGDLPPDSGRVRFKGRDITRAPASARAHLGIARSFQITSVFQNMSLLENVALSVQAREGHSFRFWAPAAEDEGLNGKAREFLASVGLEEKAGVRAREVSHGEHRQLEIAMALATEPDLLLLDEPMAGMGTEETAQMIEILRRFKGEKTMLLVEHDMDAVFALADRISVLVYGEVIATDSPDAIRDNDDVKRAYLGEEGA